MNQYYLCWLSLFIGAVSGLLLSLLLGLSVIFINIYLISAQTTNTSSLFFLLAFSYVIAMYFTGFISGKLYSCKIENDYFGFLIGFLAWSIVLIVLIILLNNGIQYTSSHFRAVSIRIIRSSLELRDGFSISHGYTSIVTLEPKASFLTFFYGALSSCLGGYMGYRKPA